MQRRVSLLAGMVMILATFLLGCGGGGSSSGGGSTAIDVSGTWRGTGYAPQTGSAPTTLILSQSGNNVSGTWDGYAVTGTVSGNQLTLTFTPFTQNGVSISGGGGATVTGNNMSSGTMSMTGTSGNTSVTINVTFTATRSSSAAKADHAPAGGLVAAVAGAIAK
jgi:hypothetical protein